MDYWRVFGFCLYRYYGNSVHIERVSMGKLTEWEKGLLEQVECSNDPRSGRERCVTSYKLTALVVYGIAALVAVLVFMWGQT